MTFDPVPGRAIAALVTSSFAATAFLFWLIYLRAVPGAGVSQLTFLPAFDALMNGVTTAAILVGFVLIRLGRVRPHRRAMFTAFVCSTLFLAGYVLDHSLHGTASYPPHGRFHGLYVALLASHLALSVLALPLVLATFFLSLSHSIAAHRRLAHWVYPLWLYIAVSGLASYLMLHLACQ